MSLNMKDEEYLDKLRRRHEKDGLRLDALQDRYRIVDVTNEHYEQVVRVFIGLRSGERVRLFQNPPTDEIELDDLRNWYRWWDKSRVRSLTFIRALEKQYNVDRSPEGKKRLR